MSKKTKYKEREKLTCALRAYVNDSKIEIFYLLTIY
jgi:hypothetical protein